MHCSAVTATHSLAVCAALVIVVVSLFEQTSALPATPGLVTSKRLSHVIRTRSLKSQKYCGHHIVSILSMLCDGNYFGPSKRNNRPDETKQNTLNNGIAPFWDDMAPKGEYNKPDDTSDEYFLEPEKAFNMFGSSSSESTGADGFTRNRRGIVDECCRKACTIRELVSYCQ